MQYVGIDWAYSRAAWCARMEGGAIAAEGLIPADEDGLARLVLRLGPDVKACVEMMSGAAWVRDQLAAASWAVEVADARKVKALAPLTAKTDKVDARLLSELSRRDLVPALWVPPLDERALRERLRRRMHLVRLRTSAKGRVFGLQTQWGLRISLERLRQADGLELLERRGMPEVWRRSIAECLAVIDFLDERLRPLEAELRPFARLDRRAVLLDTIPGVGELLALTLAVEIGDVARFLLQLLVGYVGGEAAGFLVDMACEEVAEEAEAGQDSEDGTEVDLDGAGEVRGRSALRCHLERPSHTGGDGDEVKEVDPACG
jgi:transposase